MPIAVPPNYARTLGDLKARIADELARADLSSQIALAIEDAIEEAATHRFWFMEVRGMSIPISAGTAQYTSDDIERLIEIDRLKLVTGTQTRTLRVMDDAEIDRLNDGTAPEGEPYGYSRYGDQLTLYPTPRVSYTVTIDGLTEGARLTVDGDSNIWTTHGERYIRALAKRNVLADVIHDDQAAMTQDALAARYRNELWAQTDSRTTTGEMAACG